MCILSHYADPLSRIEPPRDVSNAGAGGGIGGGKERGGVGGLSRSTCPEGERTISWKVVAERRSDTVMITLHSRSLAGRASRRGLEGRHSLKIDAFVLMTIVCQTVRTLEYGRGLARCLGDALFQRRVAAP